MTQGSVAAAVLLAKKHRAGRKAATEKPKAVHVESASDLLVELTDSVLKTIERRRAYFELALFLLFAVLYLTVLGLQRNTHLSFQVEESHRSSFFNLATSTQEYDDGRISRDIPSTDAFYTWLSNNVVKSSWVEPKCGDGLCSTPLEFPAFAAGRFGCAADCSTFANLTKVSFNFTLDFDDSLVDEGWLEDIRWDLCSDTWDVCFAANKEAESTFPSSRLNATVTYELPDGDWRLVFDTPIGNVGGSVSYTVGGTETVLTQFDRCAAHGAETVATFGEWRRFGYECRSGEDDFGGGDMPPMGPGPPADDDDDYGYADDGGGGSGGMPPPGPPSATPTASSTPSPSPSATASPSPSPPPRCPDHCVSFVNDNCCTSNPECYSELCEWDGGDCCPPVEANLGRQSFRFTLNAFGQGPPSEVFPEDGATIRRSVGGSSNLIVAGVLLVQKRRQNAGCVNVGRFDALYDHCKSSTESVAPYGVDPVFLPTSALYDSRNIASQYYSTAELDPAGIPYGFFHHASPHSDADSGYHVYWDVNLKASRATQLVTYLQEGFFIDSQTESISVQAVTFNGESGIMTRSEVLFSFDTAGSIFMTQAIDGVVVEVYGTQDVSSVAADTHDVGPTRSDTDTRTLRLVLEVIVLVGLVLEALVFVYRTVTAPSRRQSIVKHLTSLWTFVELVHLVLLFVSVALWIRFWDAHAKSFNPASRYEAMNDRVHSNAPQARPRMLVYSTEDDGDEADAMLKMFADMRALVSAREQYFSVAGISVIFVILRLLSYLHFQPRMGLVSRTIERAGADIAHFLVLFLLVLVGYAIAGHLLFGSRVRIFSTIGVSLVTCMEILLGEIDVNRDLMRDDNRISALIWFWSLTVVLFLILLNVFLAILLDAFIEIKRHASESQAMPNEIMDITKELYAAARRPDVPYVRSDGHATAKHTAPFLNDEELIEALFEWSKAHKSGRRLLEVLGLTSFLAIPRTPAQAGSRDKQQDYAMPVPPAPQLTLPATSARVHPSTGGENEPDAKPTAATAADDLSLTSIQSTGADLAGGTSPAPRPPPTPTASSVPGPGRGGGGGGGGAAGQLSRDFFATLARVAGFVPPGETPEALTPLSKLPPLFGWSDLEYRIFANYAARYQSTSEEEARDVAAAGVADGAEAPVTAL